MKNKVDCVHTAHTKDMNLEDSAYCVNIHRYTVPVHNPAYVQLSQTGDRATCSAHCHRLVQHKIKINSEK